MTKAELYELLEDPRKVGAEHIAGLEQLLMAYPYASSFVFLYLYALAKTEDIRYPAELKRLVAYLPSREAFYRLLKGLPQPTREDVKAVNEEVDAFGLIESFLEGARASGESLPEDLLFTGGERNDYLGAPADADTTDEPLPFKRVEEPSPTYVAEGEGQELFSETLAKIYIQQGKYERALRIIKNLHLHYPQKNRYFAVQIRFLERLIENNNRNKDL